jgi:3-phenylpropionate/cinnamic acid dioxygenase small subunit
MLTPDDHVEIHRVLADYGHVVDDHDWDRAEEVFTPDVTFDAGAGGTVLHGIGEIVATFKGRNFYAHITTNTTLREESDTAVAAHSKFIGFPTEGAPVTGDYYDRLVRTSAGWRLHQRRAEIRQRKFFD